MQSVNLGSEQESTHPTQNVIGDDETYSDVQYVPWSTSGSGPLSRRPSIVQVKKKGKSLYRSMIGKVAALWGVLMRVNFVFSIVAMMVITFIRLCVCS